MSPFVYDLLLRAEPLSLTAGLSARQLCVNCVGTKSTGSTDSSGPTGSPKDSKDAILIFRIVA